MNISALRVPALLALAAFTMAPAHAGIINFITMIENGGSHGESAWSTLNLSTDGVGVAIQGLASNDNDTQQFAYLDRGNAGLGVCKDLLAGAAVNTLRPGSGTNLCAPGSDDNITVGEYLSFVFDANVYVRLWFNNNHDGGFLTNDKVKIGGQDFGVKTGYATSAASPNGLGLFQVARGAPLLVGYSSQEFYVSGMEVTLNTGVPPGTPVVGVVPEPTSLALAGLAVAGAATIRRRRHRG